MFRGTGLRVWIRQSRIRIPTPTLAGCVALGKLLHFSELPLSHLYCEGKKRGSFPRPLWGLGEPKSDVCDLHWPGAWDALPEAPPCC